MIRRVGVLTILFAVMLAAPAGAEPVSVDCNAPNLTTRINQANANPGTDKLVLAKKCTYVLLTALPPIADSVVIDGNGATLLRNSPGQFRLLLINVFKTVKIKNLSFIGGHALDGEMSGDPGASGGAILNNGALTLSHVTISGSVAGDGGDGASIAPAGGSGGGIYNGVTGILTLKHVSMRSNNAGNGGIGTLTGGAGGNGGAIANAGELTVKDSTIANNGAGNGGVGLSSGTSGDGGGIYSSPKVAKTSDTKVKDNFPNDCAPSGNVSHCAT